MSFIKAEAARRLQHSPLMTLEKIVDWERIASLLGNVGRSPYGPQGYAPVQLFKALLLQAWHSLSDPALEEVNHQLQAPHLQVAPAKAAIARSTANFF